MVYCVGLTGGIGCGKSTVAQMFEALGAAIIDTDAISHALTQPNAPGLKPIAHQFGPDFISPQGTLNRAKLRTLVFSNAAAKTMLESILHPLIEAHVHNAISLCHTRYALIVVPLLFETSRYLPLIQRKLVVDCEENTQIARAVARNHLTAAEVRAIMSHQLPRIERLQHADDILQNNGDLDALRAAVEALDKKYQMHASRSR